MTNGLRDWYLDTRMVSNRVADDSNYTYLGGQCKGRVPWPNSRAFLQDLDILPCGPRWTTEKFTLEGRYQYVLCVYKRHVVDVVRDLISNPALRDNIIYAPQRLWTSVERLMRIMDEMWTCEWWWRTQVSLRHVQSDRYLPNL
jgi:hypothetical protein